MQNVQNLDPRDRGRDQHSFTVQHALIVADDLSDHHNCGGSDEAFYIRVLGAI